MPTETGQVVQTYSKVTDARTGAVSAYVRATGYGSVPWPTYPDDLEGATLEREEEVRDGDKITRTRYYSTPGNIEHPVTEYQLDVSLSNEKIETHPNFKTFAIDDNGAEWDATTGEFRGFTKRPKDGWTVNNEQWIGVSDYLAPGAVWREIKYGGSFDGLLTNVGQISTPPGPCPAGPNGTNWLYMGGSASQQRGQMVVRREWRLSGPRGWSQDLYGT